MEKYAYGRRKDVICKKEKIEQFSVIKAFIECLTLIMLQIKT